MSTILEEFFRCLLNVYIVLCCICLSFKRLFFYDQILLQILALLIDLFFCVLFTQFVCNVNFYLWSPLAVFQRYLRTGDLGFIYENELFVCGRVKDLIIVRGRNHYPQDLERCIESAEPLLRPGCSAAFAVTEEGSSEEIVIVAEVRDVKAVADTVAADVLVQKLVQQLTQTYGVVPNNIILVAPRTIPKTTSGKIARTRARWAFLGRPQSVGDTLQVLHKWHRGDLDITASSISRDSSGIGHAGASTTANFATNDGNSVQSAFNAATARPRNVKLLESTKGKEIMKQLKEEVVLLLPEDSGVSPDSLDERRPLLQLGLDSMVLEQLRSTLESDHGVEGMSTEMLFLNSVSLEALVELVLDTETTLEWMTNEVEKYHQEHAGENESVHDATESLKVQNKNADKVAPEPQKLVMMNEQNEAAETDIRSDEDSSCCNCVIS